MKKTGLLLSAISSIFLFSTCKKDYGTKPDKLPPAIVLQEGQQKISGKIALKSADKAKDIKIVTTSGTYPVATDGTFETATNKLPKQFIFAENKKGEVLYASLLEAGNDGMLNAGSTARSIIAMHPWTAYTGTPAELKSLLDEIATYKEYKQLETAIQEAVDSDQSSLTAPSVTEALTLLIKKLTDGNSSLKKVAASSSLASINSLAVSIPEIDFLVEPKLTFANNSLKIENDGLTTAAWGVDVLVDGQSLTGNLVLSGNKIKFPSLGSILNAFSGDISDAVFEHGEPLEVPMPIPAKYNLLFASPSSSQIHRSSLAREAARYNIFIAYQTIFTAFGINPSNLFGQGCINDIFDATTTSLVDAIGSNKLTSAFFFDQVGNLFSGSAQSLAECAALFDNFPGSVSTAREAYLKKLSSFLNAYSKLEAAFVLGKLFGDMAVLNDISICRQVINGKIYPCFTLIEKTGISDKTYGLKEPIDLQVGTKLDMPGDENTTYPEGAEINWKIVSGKGKLQAEKSTVTRKGEASMKYTAEAEGEHIISAYTTDKDYLTYVLSVKDVDSTAIYQRAVLGSWTVQNTESAGETYSLVLYEDGQGRYIVPGPEGANRHGIDENNNSYYTISWKIIKSNGKYFLSERGFWHPGFEDYRTFDVTLPNVALSYPITGFTTYTDFGQGASTSRKYRKN